MAGIQCRELNWGRERPWCPREWGPLFAERTEKEREGRTVCMTSGLCKKNTYLKVAGDTETDRVKALVGNKRRNLFPNIIDKKTR